ncbi:MAG: sulfatase-like hydrolase/transferase [Acidobacteria bacterium]|nr:sulfatase-like hydrolase/transferase [Acidobacteriota bacterium]
MPDAFAIDKYRLRPNLPESFGAAGYRTGYIGKWHLGEQNPGFFDHWNAFNSLKPHWLGKPHESVYRNDADTEDALQFLAANRANPFLLFVSYYPPHTPYTAPRRFHGFYEGKNLQPMEYYAAASNVSWNIGRLREQLSKLGLDRRTCVVFSTDHGETFGRRPGSKNKRVCYDDSARIPLLMSLPGRLAAGLAWRSGVSNVDIMPTLLGIAGLKPVRSADGRNLFPRILAREDRWTGPVVIQNITQPLPDGATAVERAIRTERWKLIIKQPVSRPREYVYELYDMNSDPGESRNLFDAGHARTAGYLANELAAWASRFRDPLAAAFAAECIRGLPA